MVSVSIQIMKDGHSTFFPQSNDMLYILQSELHISLYFSSISHA